MYVYENIVVVFSILTNRKAKAITHFHTVSLQQIYINDRLTISTSTYLNIFIFKK